MLVKGILASSVFGNDLGVLLFSSNLKFVEGLKWDGSLLFKLQAEAGSEDEENLLFE